MEFIKTNDTSVAKQRVTFAYSYTIIGGKFQYVKLSRFQSKPQKFPLNISTYRIFLVDSESFTAIILVGLDRKTFIHRNLALNGS